ncbi:hypothetical protein OQJ68_16470 [Microbulbifer thermotolerans]|uniref:RHS repeat-associated core domain-containing protein n=1 Tax=Microbulbifer thermotolerans TaxID=252514 RepID=A0AB35I3X8_MICTH|nr:RHS repeat-associated core domain-containing protein [Microbulbifer thermotolerans]MCX2803373.1 hypothetical protein [Microbulbifer thermotolerans]
MPYLHTDHLNTPRIGTDSNEVVIWRWDSDAFGQAAPDTDPDSDREQIVVNLRFPEQIQGDEAAFYYNYFRDYDSSLGRYLQSDPIGLRGGLNTYAYVDGNPLNFVDPLGLYTEIIIWQPVGHSSSSFGHVSSNVNGNNYSWGPGGWDTKYPNASDYASRQQAFRSGVGQILNLTPEQEAKLVACYAKHGGDYSAFSNNCGDPHRSYFITS